MPRIWFSGPRVLGGFVRPGISFNWNELYSAREKRPPARLPVDDAKVIFVMKDVSGRFKIAVSNDPRQYMAKWVGQSASIVYVAALNCDGYKIMAAACKRLASIVEPDGWFKFEDVPPGYTKGRQEGLAIAAITTSAYEMDESLVSIRRTNYDKFFAAIKNTQSRPVDSHFIGRFIFLLAALTVLIVSWFITLGLQTP